MHMFYVHFTESTKIISIKTKISDDPFVFLFFMSIQPATAYVYYQHRFILH